MRLRVTRGRRANHSRSTDGGRLGRGGCYDEQRVLRATLLHEMLAKRLGGPREHAISAAPRVVVQAACVKLDRLLVVSAHDAQVKPPVVPPWIARVFRTLSQVGFGLCQSKAVRGRN